MFYHRFYLFLYLFQREISELRRLISGKFCTVIISRLNFIMLVQNFWEPSAKNCKVQKICKILLDFWMNSNFGDEYLQKG